MLLQPCPQGPRLLKSRFASVSLYVSQRTNGGLVVGWLEVRRKKPQTPIPVLFDKQRDFFQHRFSVPSGHRASRDPGEGAASPRHLCITKFPCSAILALTWFHIFVDYRSGHASAQHP
jgi:hypothetical protein